MDDAPTGSEDLTAAKAGWCGNETHGRVPAGSGLPEQKQSEPMKRERINLDTTAMGLSGLCLIHCLALPVLVTLMPALSTVAEMEWMHKAFVLLAWPVTLTAILRRTALSSASHTRFSVVACSGLLLLSVAAFVEALHDFETPLTILGGLTLGAAHFWRWRKLGALAQTARVHPQV
jgi:hypothetical protein